jgi:hypothetical protein
MKPTVNIIMKAVATLLLLILLLLLLLLLPTQHCPLTDFKGV